MCGCRNKGVTRSPNTTARALPRVSTELCKPIEFYRDMDTSNWTPNEKAILKSHLIIYDKNCRMYSALIDDIYARYN